MGNKISDKKILVVGAPRIERARERDLLNNLKEHKDNVEILSTEELKERGVIINSLSHLKSEERFEPLIQRVEQHSYKSGKELRGERRKQERKANKRK